MNNKPGNGSADALVIIDVQVDFCPGGALPIQEGDRVVPEINRWIEKFKAQNLPIIASRDWHPLQHLSFETQGGAWPPHCLQDSEGARFHPDLQLPEDTILVTKGVRFDQDQYSVFDQTGLEALLKRMNVQHLWVTGLALDVCVRASVLDARKCGFAVTLIVDATRAVDPEKFQELIEEMEQAGVKTIHPSPPHTDRNMASGTSETDSSVCVKAPEWAEHYRLTDDDDPCDDGRSGKI